MYLIVMCLLLASINASLRDYQHSGFQWLCLLDHLGWGGCLADDMGLGKTLQTLAFLHYLNDKQATVLRISGCESGIFSSLLLAR